MNDEFLKIAPNGQWSLEKASSAYGMSSDASKIGSAPIPADTVPGPKVSAYRGMTGVTARDLHKLGIRPEPSGGISNINRPLKLKQHSWWDTNPRSALIYASTDHVSQKPSNEQLYDVFIHGETDHPGDHKHFAHALRDRGTDVMAHRVAYVPRQGTGEERSERIRQLLPDLQWVKPKTP